MLLLGAQALGGGEESGFDSVEEGQQRLVGALRWEQECAQYALTYVIIQVVWECCIVILGVCMGEMLAAMSAHHVLCRVCGCGQRPCGRSPLATKRHTTPVYALRPLTPPPSPQYMCMELGEGAGSFGSGTAVLLVLLDTRRE